MIPHVKVVITIGALAAVAGACEWLKLPWEPGGNEASVEVSPSFAAVGIGDIVALTAIVRDSAGDVLTNPVMTWSSSDAAIAEVSTSGVVTAMSAGSATVTATRDGHSGQAQIDVVTEQTPVASVEVSPSSATVYVDGTLQLEAIVRDADGNVLSGRSVTWSSSNTATASVNGDGMVMGMAEGSATITATSEGQTGSAAIEVRVYQPGEWPDNEPAGMTTIVFADGSNKYFDSGAFVGSAWDDDNRVSVVDAPDAKYGGKAIQKRFFVGDGSGWHGIYSKDNWQGSYRELYVRTVVKLSGNWDDHSGGQKLFYFGSEAGQPNDYYVWFRLSNNDLRFVTQVASGVRGSDGADTFWPGGHNLVANQFMTIELHIVAQSGPGASDGSLTMWQDGQRIGSWSGLQFYNSGASSVEFDGYQTYLYWGGSGDTKTANDWVQISEFYVSGKQ